VHIAVERPSGVPGRTLTIDASALEVVPGLHSTQIILAIEARSSRSADHRITLPADAEAVQVQRDKNVQPLRREGRDIVLSMPLGKHDFTVEWRQPAGLATLFRVPAVDLQLPSMNNTVNVKLPDKPRWILWLSGPFVGPVVNFWALVLVIALISIALARIRLTPLRTRHWFFLGLGLCQVDLVWMVLVGATLLGLGWRARRQPNEAQPVLYNASQAALVLGLLVSIVTVTIAVSDGLVRMPDMWIAGNNVSASGLAWYQDRVGNPLAQPSVLSLPPWTYRVLVMAWTLWLGLAAIRWSGWVWGCLKQHGLWRGNAKPFTLP
jgi:hypothetical protein